MFGAERTFGVERPFGAERPFRAERPFDAERLFGADRPFGAERPFDDGISTRTYIHIVLTMISAVRQTNVVGPFACLAG